MSVTSIRTKDQSVDQPANIYQSTQMVRTLVRADYFTNAIKQREPVDEIAPIRTKYATRILQVEESSLVRRIYVFVCSIFHDMWSSMGSSIGARLGVRLEDENTASIDEQVKTLPGIANTAINSTLQSLRVQTEFNSGGVDTYCKHLSESSDVQYIPNCLVKEGISTKIKDFPKCTANNILIPIVLKEFGRDHIVCVYIKRNDDDSAVIEFYDSKGLTIADRANETLANNPNMTLGKLVAKLADRYCADKRFVTVEENMTKHQWDSHNCGIYVCHYFKERLEGTPAAEIRTNQSMGYDHTFEWRREMVNDLLYVFDRAFDEVEDQEKRPADPLLEGSDEFPSGEPAEIAQVPQISGEFVDVPLD